MTAKLTRLNFLRTYVLQLSPVAGYRGTARQAYRRLPCALYLNRSCVSRALVGRRSCAAGPRGERRGLSDGKGLKSNSKISPIEPDKAILEALRSAEGAIEMLRSIFEHCFEQSAGRVTGMHGGSANIGIVLDEELGAISRSGNCGRTAGRRRKITVLRALSFVPGRGRADFPALGHCRPGDRSGHRGSAVQRSPGM